MMPARIAAYTRPLKRNRRRDSAYPAMLAVITVSTVTTMATMAELMYQRPRSLAWTTPLEAENVKCGMFQVAGTMMVSFSLFTEVSRAHATGNSQSRARAMTTPVVARVNRMGRWRGWPERLSRRPPATAGRVAEAAMSDSTLLAADQGQPDEGHNQDDDEQDERGRGRVAHALAGERGVVDPLDGRAAGVVRPALQDQVDLVEDLQRGDDLQHGDQGGGPAQHGDGQPPGLLPAAGAVQGRGLVQVARDLLQAGQVEHEVEADRPPHGDDDDRVDGHVRVGQPARGTDPDQVEEPGQHAINRLVDEQPAQGDGRRGQNVGQEKGQPEEPLPTPDPVDHDGEEQRQDDQRRGGDPR